MKVAIATNIIGNDSQVMWHSIYRWTWDLYAERMGFDVKFFTQRPENVGDVPPHWDKLLMLERPELEEYDHVIYLDHDVAISPAAPDVIDSMGSESDKIGVVTWRGSYFADPFWLDLHKESWQYNQSEWVRNIGAESFQDLQRAAGYEDGPDDWLNSGVIVMTPKHKELMRGIWEEHSPKHGTLTSKEQAALIYEFCGRYAEAVHCLDRRFNVLWDMQVNAFYQFLGRMPMDDSAALFCLQACMNRHWFIHFIDGPAREHGKNLLKHFQEQPAVEEVAA